MTDHQFESEGAPVPARPTRPPARAWARWRPALLLIVAVVALGALLDAATASPRVCMSCHEMQVRAGAWARSGHGGVSCVSCHQRPRPVYDVPGRLGDRVALLARDVAKHLSGSYSDPVDARTRPTEPPVTDDVCLQCHTANRKATSGFRITIDHVAHAKRNGLCVSCHVRTAHPLESRGRALSFMSACFTCHGVAATAKASARCDVCHPAGYELLPASHKASTWKAKHGSVARADLKQCEMCHEKPLCDACHGIEMPHPMGWAKGRTGHGASAAKDRTLCLKCHGGTPDMCTMCHHADFNPTRGAWAGQHGEQAERRGVDFCVSCHSPIDCARCHMERRTEGPDED